MNADTELTNGRGIHPLECMTESSNNTFGIVGIVLSAFIRVQLWFYVGHIKSPAGTGDERGNASLLFAQGGVNRERITADT
jgi:hypothetical protein